MSTPGVVAPRVIALAILALAIVVALAVTPWLGRGEERPSHTTRLHHGVGWDIAVDRMDKWGVSSERVRLVCVSPGFLVGADTDSKTICDWGEAFVHDVQWTSADSVVVSGWRSESDADPVEHWRDVHIRYVWANR